MSSNLMSLNCNTVAFKKTLSAPRKMATICSWNQNVKVLTVFEVDLLWFPSWQSIIVDGHSVEELCKVLNQPHHQPLAIIAKTIKGKGIQGTASRPMVVQDEMFLQYFNAIIIQIRGSVSMMVMRAPPKLLEKNKIKIFQNPVLMSRWKVV